jgi:hypothetical protein
VSFFDDRAGQEYFMVVNLRHGKDMSKMGAAGTVRLTFDPSIAKIERLNRLTGLVEVLETRFGATAAERFLDIQLEGGTGDLFKYHTGARFAPISVLPGDANSDSVVDDRDLSILLANWTGVYGSGATWEMGDFDGSGAVAPADLSLLLANWTRLAGQAVPEPLALGVLTVGALMGLPHRRRSW